VKLLEEPSGRKTRVQNYLNRFQLKNMMC